MPERSKSMRSTRNEPDSHARHTGPLTGAAQAPMTGMSDALARRSELPSERSLLAIICRDAASTDEALSILEREGIAPDRVNVLAHGADIEKRWVRDRELCRMGERPAPGHRPLGPYARSISGGPRVLLEGCWALGPLFLGTPGTESSQSIGSLASALVRAGISLRDAVSIEADVRRHGGIWLAAEETPGMLDAIRRGFPGIRACKLPLLRGD